MPRSLFVAAAAFTLAVVSFVYVVRVGNPVWEHWSLPHWNDCDHGHTSTSL